VDKQIQMLKFYLCMVTINDLKNNVSTTLGYIFNLTFPVQDQIKWNKFVLQEKKNHLKQMNIALSRWVIFNVIKINVFIQMGNVCKSNISHIYLDSLEYVHFSVLSTFSILYWKKLCVRVHYFYWNYFNDILSAYVWLLC